MRRRIAILASGTGSNAENLAAYFQNSDVAEVALLIADRKAPVIDRLKPYGVPAVIIPRAEWRENPQKAVAVMRDAAVDLVVLAGFLTVVPEGSAGSLSRTDCQRASIAAAEVRRQRNVGNECASRRYRRRRGGERHHHPLCVGSVSTRERRLPSSVVRSPRPTPPTLLPQKSTRSSRRISLKLYKNWWNLLHKVIFMQNVRFISNKI